MMKIINMEVISEDYNQPDGNGEELLNTQLSDESNLVEVNQTKVTTCSLVQEVDETICTLKYESLTFTCSFCSEEFTEEHDYTMHWCTHILVKSSCGVSETSEVNDPRTAKSSWDYSCTSEYKHSIQKWDDNSQPAIESDLAFSLGTPSLRLVINKKKKSEMLRATEETNCIKKSNHVLEINDVISNKNPPISHNTTNINIKALKNCVVKLYDIFAESEKHKNSKIASEVVLSHTASKIEVATIKKCKISKTLKPETHSINDANSMFDISLALMLSKKKFVCDICLNKFKEKSNLIKHIKIHKELKEYTEKGKYKNHLDRNVSIGTDEKLQCCKLCEFKCSYRSQLVKHMRSHSGVKPYSCTICNFKFTRNYHLQQHMRTHTGEKPYSCKLCSYKCAGSSSLVKHIRIHSGEKPYSCSLCEYKSTRKDHLQKHIRAHNGEKPYYCKLCHFTCVDSSGLVKHMRTHTGEKPYSCKLCDYKSAQKGMIASHMRIHNGK